MLKLRKFISAIMTGVLLLISVPVSLYFIFISSLSISYVLLDVILWAGSRSTFTSEEDRILFEYHRFVFINDYKSAHLYGFVLLSTFAIIVIHALAIPKYGDAIIERIYPYIERIYPYLKIFLRVFVCTNLALSPYVTYKIFMKIYSHIYISYHELPSESQAYIEEFLSSISAKIIILLIIIMASISAFQIRCRRRTIYGVIELIFGIISVISFTDHSPPFSAINAVQLIGGIYVIVRGLDNIDHGIYQPIHNSDERYIKIRNIRERFFGKKH